LYKEGILLYKPLLGLYEEGLPSKEEKKIFTMVLIFKMNPERFCLIAGE
jgi:hypothetical protein